MRNSAYPPHCNYCFQQLFEMIRFQAEKYLRIVQDLTEADYRFKELFKGEPTNEPLAQENRDFFIGIIKDVMQLADEIKLHTLYEYLNEAQQRMSWPASSLDDAMYFNRGMRDVLVSNVKAHIFIQVAPDKRDLYFAAINNSAPLYILYPAVKHEIVEAHLCFVMERYSSCVHHRGGSGNSDSMLSGSLA